MEAILNFLLPLLNMYGEQIPFLPKVIFTIGILRVVVKPIQTAITAYVAFTPSTKDDAWWSKAKDGKIYKAVAFVLDWSASIKLPVKK